MSLGGFGGGFLGSPPAEDEAIPPQTEPMTEWFLLRLWGGPGATDGIWGMISGVSMFKEFQDLHRDFFFFQLMDHQCFINANKKISYFCYKHCICLYFGEGEAMGEERLVLGITPEPLCVPVKGTKLSSRVQISELKTILDKSFKIKNHIWAI